jgi:hypothetical protein
MDEIGNDRGVGILIPCQRRGDSCFCWRRRLAIPAATASPTSGQKGQHGEKKTRNDGGHASRYATCLCDSGPNAHLLLQKIGSDRVDLGSVYFVREVGKKKNTIEATAKRVPRKCFVTTCLLMCFNDGVTA